MNPFEENSESWPDEPEEFDPDSVGPDIPDTTPTIGESLADAGDVSDELFRAFWASVLFLNVALASLSVGVFLLYFRNDYGTGAPALLIGTVAALGAGRYYWGVRTGSYTDESSSMRDDSPIDDGECGDASEDTNRTNQTESTK